MQPARLPRWILACTMVVAAATAGTLAGCNLVTDATTGVRLARENASDCLQSCAQSLAEQVRAEAEFHNQQIHSCDGQSESDQESCRKVERTRHQQAMDDIVAARKACMDDCHRQGGGTAG